MEDSRRRREFLQRLAMMGGAFSVGTGLIRQHVSHPVPLAKRILGRTGAKVPVLGIGLGPLGIAKFSPQELQGVVETAIEEWGSPLLVDVQWDYGDAETDIAPLLKKRRADIFIVAKTWEQEKPKVIASVEDSLRRLGIDRVDAVLMNNIGLLDLDRMFKPDGALAGLQDLRRRGLIRYMGVSGHMLTRAFVRTLGTGEFDLAMHVVNFVDRHTYSFEEKVIPIAVKHNVGVMAMKVLGGSAAGYERKDQRAKLDTSDIEPAIHYALSVPGVSTAVLGCKSVEEVREAGRAARRYRPMTEEQIRALGARGRQLAKEWGTHLGEV